MKNKKSKKKDVTAGTEETAQADITEAADNVTEDEELVAVIAAAIAAAEGTTTDGFVVRSIRRRPSNKWNRYWRNKDEELYNYSKWKCI